MLQFKTEDLIRATGIDRGLVTALLQKGHLVADISHTVGRGKARLFSYRNLFEVALARRLHAAQATYSSIEEVNTWVRDLDREPPAGLGAEPRQRWLEWAADWARVRGGDPATPAYLYRQIPGPGETAALELGFGDASAPPRWPDFVRVDLLKILQELRAVTDRSWPLDEIREMDERLAADSANVDDRGASEDVVQSRRDQEAVAEKEERLENIDRYTRSNTVRDVTEVLRIDGPPALYPKVALDGRLRAHYGLGPKTYGGRWWESRLLTEDDIEQLEERQARLEAEARHE